MPSTATSRRSGARDRLVHVRLCRADLDALHDVMRTLNLRSTSDALRVGLRLLAREAAEVRAADEIYAFFGRRLAEPAGDGLAPIDTAVPAVIDGSP